MLPTSSRSATRRRLPVPTASGMARRRPSCRVSSVRTVPRAPAVLVRTSIVGDLALVLLVVLQAERGVLRATDVVEVSVLRDQAEALVQYTVPAEGTVTRAITGEARAAPTTTSFDRD